MFKHSKLFFTFEGSCALNRAFTSRIDFCDEEYNFLNEEKANYSLKWSQQPSLGASNTTLESFRYTHASDIDGYPYLGIYGTYQGGGYVYRMVGSASELSSNLSTLQSLNWIDRQTRAVFVEFSLYSPNSNMFAYCMVLFDSCQRETLCHQCESARSASLSSMRDTPLSDWPAISST